MKLFNVIYSISFIFRTILLSVRTQKLNQNDPVDPPQGDGSQKQHVNVRKARSRELPELASPVEERRKSSGEMVF